MTGFIRCPIVKFNIKMVVFEDTELYRWQRLFPVIGLDWFRRAALAVRYRQQNIIFVRKALHIRPRDQQCVCIVKLAGKDMRFSMKMMFAPYIEPHIQPSESGSIEYGSMEDAYAASKDLVERFF